MDGQSEPTSKHSIRNSETSAPPEADDPARIPTSAAESFDSVNRPRQPETTTGARPVLDHHRLTEVGSHFLLQYAAKKVGCAASRIANHPFDRALWIVLRL